MLNRFVAAAIVIAGIGYAPAIRAQNGAPPSAAPNTPRESGKNIHRDGWDKIVPEPPKQTGGPAPVRDLSGTWEPIPGYRDGVFATGPKQYPSDGKPEHELPFTPLGLKTWKEHKPGFGTTAVPIAQNNDPFDSCDPIGFPRVELFNLRAIQFYQSKTQTAILYQNDQVWRNIWTDGRVLPAPDDTPEPRWYGYSVGKWVDDYTFVVETDGLDSRTWIDNVGRPLSDQLKVTETWHRVNHDILELTLTINDPVMYTKPWNALDKFRLGLQPDWFDIREQVCAPSEESDYTKTVADEADTNKK